MGALRNKKTQHKPDMTDCAQEKTITRKVSERPTLTLKQLQSSLAEISHNECDETISSHHAENLFKNLRASGNDFVL